MSGSIPPSDEHDDDELLGRLVDGKPSEGERSVEHEAYEELIERIRDLPDISPPAGWEDRLQAKRTSHERTERRKRAMRRVVPVGFSLMTAAAVVFIYVAVVKPRAKTEALVPENEIGVSEGPGAKMRSDDEAKRGDILVMKVARREPFMQVRVYQGQREVFRCSGGAACAEASFPLEESGTYRVIIVAGFKPLPEGNRNLDIDLPKLQSDGFEIDQSRDPIEIR